jgi:nucleoid-associated protein EbfC
MEVKALQQMLAQFRQVQEGLERQMDGIRVEVSTGGGMVTLVMNGQKQVTDVHIEPEVFEGRDREMLEDLVRSAMNEATRRVDEELAKQMKDLAAAQGGLKIPGLF